MVWSFLWHSMITPFLKSDNSVLRDILHATDANVDFDNYYGILQINEGENDVYQYPDIDICVSVRILTGRYCTFFHLSDTETMLLNTKTSSVLGTDEEACFVENVVRFTTFN